SPVPGQVARLHALLGLPAPDAPTNAGSAGNAGSPASTGSPTGTGWPTRTGSPADTDTSAGPGPSAGPGSPFGTDAPAGPGVPRRWLDVVSYYGRRRPLRPVSGTASIGVPTAAIDGVRFAVAGLHSDPNSTHLLVIARGLSPLPQRVPPGLEGDAGFSWWLRDDAGGWHLAVIDEAIPAAAEETVLRMALLPPLAFAATALIAEITGPSARVTITLPLRW
ncbi:MAG: hypothetical protein J2P26_03485, partial [Nocardiopsaceae bacterium]|nr:hypothetical protein [Nocardiopsaceae bacterium]